MPAIDEVCSIRRPSPRYRASCRTWTARESSKCGVVLVMPSKAATDCHPLVHEPRWAAGRGNESGPGSRQHHLASSGRRQEQRRIVYRWQSTAGAGRELRGDLWPSRPNPKFGRRRRLAGALDAGAAERLGAISPPWRACVGCACGRRFWGRRAWSIAQPVGRRSGCARLASPPSHHPSFFLRSPSTSCSSSQLSIQLLFLRLHLSHPSSPRLATTLPAPLCRGAPASLRPQPQDITSYNKQTRPASIATALPRVLPRRLFHIPTPHSRTTCLSKHQSPSTSPRPPRLPLLPLPPAA